MSIVLKTFALNMVMGIALLLGPHPAAATPVTASPDQIKAFIRHYEATSDYDRYYAGITSSPPRALTRMTVAEVMAWQRSLGRVTSTASGTYQIIKGTLRGLVDRYDIDRNELFDRQMQDHLADLLLRDCASDLSNVVRYGNCVAHIWAALPLLSGPNAGKSAYHDIAGNRALTSLNNYKTMLQGDGGQMTQIVEGGAAVLTYQARVEQMQAELDAERELGQATVWNLRPYSN